MTHRISKGGSFRIDRRFKGVGRIALRIHWNRACRAIGVSDLTLQDLRHFYGQMLINAGRPEVSVQHGLRHADPRMTRRYTRQRDRGENAAAMEEIMFPASADEAAKGA
ncbi:MAG: tyrosine-type recombinase/integrase [Dehalococcoidia bacterium]|nr:MAG: tyrosine-type recombinase/integrase [Dehalococcoidia bacterium]